MKQKVKGVVNVHLLLGDFNRTTKLKCGDTQIEKVIFQSEKCKKKQGIVIFQNVLSLLSSLYTVVIADPAF